MLVPGKSFNYTYNNMKEKLQIGKLVRKTAGGRHGVFETEIGNIRKPL